jgi:hypothetical protein
MIEALIAVATFAILAALATAIGAEFLGWLPVLVRFLVRLSVRQLPPKERERYGEKFLYDIESKATGRKITALVWSMGICISAHRLARTLQEPKPQKNASRGTRH